MDILEIVLLVGGILCIIASFFVGEKVSDDKEQETLEAAHLSQQDKEYIRQQINELIEEQISDVSERTEAKLDKISNTKIMEMNDYAETVISEINRNHNETVFLYDMLNEKAKEVKSTVKDVNIAKKEVAHTVKAQIKQQDDAPQTSKKDNATSVKNSSSDVSNRSAGNNNRDLAKERLIEQVKKSAERAGQPLHEAESNNNFNKTKTSKKVENTARDSKLQERIAQIKNDSNAGKNDIIIAMHKLGMSNKEVAKELNLGVGEVKLVIDLYSNAE